MQLQKEPYQNVLLSCIKKKLVIQITLLFVITKYSLLIKALIAIYIIVILIVIQKLQKFTK